MKERGLRPLRDNVTADVDLLVRWRTLVIDSDADDDVGPKAVEASNESGRTSSKVRDRGRGIPEGNYCTTAALHCIAYQCTSTGLRTTE